MSKRLIAGLVGLSLLSACTDDNDKNKSDSTYNAQITRTTHGTAHITAQDYGSLGFGQGYAFAEDRFCTLMDQIVKVRGERSKYYGPGGAETQEHLLSDLAYGALRIQERSLSQLALLDDNSSNMLTGYAAGFNAYLKDTGADNLPGACQSAEWVSEITTQDLMAYYLDIATLAGSRNFLPAIAYAQPPQAVMAAQFVQQAQVKISKDHASNGIAVGSELSATEGGVLLSNTHLPWEGELVYHEVHLTIPNELDVAGVSLSGAMGVQLGFNQSMAWTHTTSPSYQFLMYQLALDPSDSTRYMLDGISTAMTSHAVSVDVKGLAEPIVQTYYDTVFGPIVEADPLGLSWNSQNAFAIFDMNIDNGGFIATFLKMAKAENVTELQQVFENNGGVPWNHTMATDTTGQVFYADTTFVPNLHPMVEQAYLDVALTPDPTNMSELIVAGAFANGLVILSGHTAATLPTNTAEQRIKSSVPFTTAPQTFRNDYVMNSNDSYWLANLEQPLAAAPSRFYGNAGEVPRSFRTRMGLTQVEELQANSVTGKTLRDLLFANRGFTAELWRNEICSDNPSVIKNSADANVDLSNACQIITNTWDGKLDLESRGAHLFREAVTAVKTLTNAGTIDGIQMFTIPYDQQNPLTTPAGLTAEGRSLLQTGLADGITRLNENNIALDAKLGDVQFTRKGDEKIPLHGGLQKIDGAYNKIEYQNKAYMHSTMLPKLVRADVVNEPTNLTTEGYLINYGASYIMSVEFGEAGPEANALLTYSQSNHQSSDFFKDQTLAYSNKQWRSVPFSTQAVSAAAVASKQVKSAF